MGWKFWQQDKTEAALSLEGLQQGVVRVRQEVVLSRVDGSTRAVTVTGVEAFRRTRRRPHRWLTTSVPNATSDSEVVLGVRDMKRISSEGH